MTSLAASGRQLLMFEKRPKMPHPKSLFTWSLLQCQRRLQISQVKNICNVFELISVSPSPALWWTSCCVVSQLWRLFWISFIGLFHSTLTANYNGYQCEICDTFFSYFVTQSSTKRHFAKCINADKFCIYSKHWNEKHDAAVTTVTFLLYFFENFTARIVYLKQQLPTPGWLLNVPCRSFVSMCAIITLGVLALDCSVR